jgi:hypothetical protein
MVNRLWQHLFGQGLVPSPENFGLGGERPTHPELLEWLSVEFVRGGWRIKPLLKLLMTSSTYRQASAVADGLPAGPDPGNQLLWRMRLRRHEAEVVRDSLLAVSGRLNRTLGGPPALLNALPDGMVVIAEKVLPRATAKDRRSLYLLARRAYNLSLLTDFDQPLIADNCARRDASAVPLQSLALLNDPFVAEQAGHFAARVAQKAGTTGEKPVRDAFCLALARPPSTAETQWCSRLLLRQAEVYRGTGLTAEESERKALVQLCHTLFNTSEFLYAECGLP